MAESPSQPNRTVVPLGRSPAVMVGRQQEMGLLKSALEDALSGHGRLVMLVGEPGIGKTRLAQELAAYADTLGGQVLWGRCYEEEGAPSYWPWVQIIRSYLQKPDPQQLRSEMGSGAACIAGIVSEVGEKLVGLELPPPLAPEQARFRLFDSIANFLRNVAESQPLVLVLDDLHWADKPSLLLLQFLARQLGQSRLLLLGCYRNVEVSRQHPVSETLAQLAREPVFQREVVQGLSPEDTGSFIAAAAGIHPTHELVETLHTHTEGNPFFLVEMLRLLRDKGELTEASQPAAGVRIPESIREVVGQRLNRLSELCNQTMTIASIIGREFDFKLLAALSDGITEDQLLQVIDEALKAHLIEEVPGRMDGYQFSHALIHETLSEGLSTSRRVRLHARIGETLERSYGADAESHAAELLYHFAEAVTVIAPDKLVRYSLLAGEQALATHAHEEALGYFERALAARDVGAPSPRLERPVDADTAALLYGLGRAQAATLPRHRLGEAVDSLTRSFNYYDAVKDVDRAVAVAEYFFYPPVGHHLKVAQLIQRALELVPADFHQVGRLLSRYGMAMGLVEGGDYAAAQEALNQALAIARQLGDTVLEMETLAWAARVDRFHLNFDGCLQKSNQVIELARRVDQPLAEVQAHRLAANMLTTRGDLGAAGLHAAAMLEVVQRLRDHYWEVTALVANERQARLQGRFRAAREFSDRGLELSPIDPRLLAPRALLEYELGNFGQGEAYLERLLEMMPLTAPGTTSEYGSPAVVIPLVVRVSGVTARLTIAEGLAREILSSSSVTPLVAQVARVGLALLAVLRKDAAAAREEYAALAQVARGTISPTGAAVVADPLLGLLAQTTGNLEQAVTHFEEALIFCRRAGCRPELAWTCYHYAGALLQRNGPGDHTKATSLLDESLVICRDLGMRPLVDRVLALQERAQSQPAKAPSYPHGLSEREVEVLRLIGSGKSNREVADQLVIAEGTVRRHVNNIYNKIGATNRAEATRYVLISGLLELDEAPSTARDQGSNPGQR